MGACVLQPNHAASQPSFHQLGGLHQANAMSVITIAPLFLGSWVQPYKLPLSNLPSRLGTPTASVLPPLYLSAAATAATVGPQLVMGLLSMPEAPPKVLSHEKYGTDPRTSKANADGTTFADDRDWSTGKRGVVNELWGGLDHLQAVLDAARQRDELVVLKYKREGCAACKSTIKLMEDAAVEYEGRAMFWTVDYNTAKTFCQKAAIRVVPSVQIYGDDTLLAALGLGKSAWPAFVERLDELLLSPALDDGDMERERIADEEIEARLQEAFARSMLW